MTENRAYLDWNATTPLRLDARAAMAAAFDVVGNPSSVHGEGRKAAAILRDARDAVADLVGAASDRVVFTSGGTEANAAVVRPDLYDRIIVSAVEHDSVKAAASSDPARLVTIPVDVTGEIDLTALDRLLDQTAGARVLVSVMLANNEVGTIQPVAEAAELCHAHGAVIHCDAVQAVGKLPVSMAALGVDFLTLSGHKFGGPKGVGAIVCGPSAAVTPLIRGGGQERRQRAGTENLIGIAGMGAAIRAAADGMDDWGRVAALRDRIEDFVGKLPGVGASAPVLIAPEKRLPNTTAVALPGLKADMMVMTLDLEGVAVSAGAACSSGKVKRSDVLAAMGAPAAIADATIRVSLGWETGEKDVDRFCTAFETLYRRWRQRLGADRLEVA
ncbi:cysteine desulfurase family protein [Rhodobium gokarnense]|uniref:Cysteine desulfurase n=1 Tax=Rhodobium gokarnense TaxID=364296 RepID=A0ABT3HAL1_9HYPH|nr:cysteine desulfurase family protein [Rhodobium gokarnense]MCW2307427.1 cysteine desulfurase [Rhodobium gokarnense]